MQGQKDRFQINSEELRSRTVEEQFQKDGETWATYLSDEQGSQATKDIMKRIFTVLELGDLHANLTSGERNVDVATRNKDLKSISGNSHPPLTPAALLSHGGRVKITIPPLKDTPDQDQNAFIRWLIGGLENLEDTKSNKTNKRSVFYRSAATHTFKRTNEEVKEKKISSFNPLHYPTFLKDFLNKRHLGMNVGLGDENKVAPENGSYGHVYMHWLPPEENKPGGLLIGCENSPPGKADRYGNMHDFRAKSAEFSPTGGQKFKDKKFKGYNLQPTSQNGFVINLDEKKMKAIMQEEVKEFNVNSIKDPIGEAKPSQRQQAVVKQEEKHKEVDNQPKNKKRWMSWLIAKVGLLAKEKPKEGAKEKQEARWTPGEKRYK